MDNININEQNNMQPFPAIDIALREKTVKKQKKAYFASFLWKLTLSLAIMFVAEAVLAVGGKIFTAVLDALSKRGMLSFYMTLKDIGAVDTVSAIFQYIYLLVGDACGLLSLYFLTFKDKSYKPNREKLNFGWWLLIMIICFGIGGVGAIIGAIVEVFICLPATITKLLLSSLSGSNLIQEMLYANDSWAYYFLGVLTVGILVPVLEELIFRKILIDKTSKYGFGAAIMISGFTFAVFHGNFIQFFYAFSLGILFAYVYCKTGNIWNTIFFHMGYNMYSSAIIPLSSKMLPDGFSDSVSEILEKMSNINTEDPLMAEIAMKHANEELWALFDSPLTIFGAVYSVVTVCFYLLLVFIGIILALCFIGKALKIRKGMMLGQKGTKRCAAFNWGAILFYCLGAAAFGLYYMAQYLIIILGDLL